MGFLIILTGLIIARLASRLWSRPSRLSQHAGEYLSSTYRAKRAAAIRDYQQRSSLAAR
jgi:hypothetical protein